MNLLAAIRLTYLNLLTDSPGANTTEARLRQLDPAWYPERGKTTALLVTSESGIPRQVVAANRQTAILNKMEAIDQGAAPGEKIAWLESLLAEKPKPEIKQVIDERLLRAAAEARDKNAVVKYGETLLALAPGDTAVRAEVALALADGRTDLPKALRYARRAVATTAEFQPAQRPINTDDSQFRAAFTETKQHENYQRQRALALEALGWALHQTGDYRRAESALRESVELRWSESNLSRLSENLLKQGRAEEAQKMAAEAKKIFVESITRRFTSTPAKDFTIEGIDGRTYKLSALKGKAILVNFWATWCAPCRAELPLLNKAYERYKDQGFEVLAVSVDDKPFRHMVAPFARQNRMSFPVVFADEGHQLYNISSYPTSIFVDRQGNVRYQQRGAFTDDRVLETIVTELLR